MPDEAPSVVPAVTSPPAGASGPAASDADGTSPAAIPTTGHAPGGMRRRVDQGRRWVVSKRFWAEGILAERRKRGGIVAAGYDVQGFDADVGGGILAGAVAFRMFLFMVPFVYVVFTILGLVADTANENPADLAKTVGITGVLASAVVNTQDQSAWTQLVLVTGATMALFLTARSLVKTLFVVNWLIWRTPRVKPTGQRPVLVLIGFALVVTVLGAVLNHLRSSAGVLGAVLMVCLVAAVAFGLWWWVSWILPTRRCRRGPSFLAQSSGRSGWRCYTSSPRFGSAPWWPGSPTPTERSASPSPCCSGSTSSVGSSSGLRASTPRSGDARRSACTAPRHPIRCRQVPHHEDGRTHIALAARRAVTRPFTATRADVERLRDFLTVIDFHSETLDAWFLAPVRSGRSGAPELTCPIRVVPVWLTSSHGPS